MTHPYRPYLMDEVRAASARGDFTVVSTFAGGAGSSTGYRLAGGQVLAFNEFVEEAQNTYLVNYPGTPCIPADIKLVTSDQVLHVADIDYGVLDVLDGSPPCFAAGTPVLTSTSIKAIEDVKIGDLVLTHQGRWRRVFRTNVKTANTILVDRRIEVTSDHLFYARTSEDGSVRSLGSPEWISARDMCGRFASVPISVDQLPIPPVDNSVRIDENFWRFVGRWLGDGWLRIDMRDVSKPRRTRAPYSTTSGQCLVCGASTPLGGRGKKYPKRYCSLPCFGKSKRMARPKPRFGILVCCATSEITELKSILEAVEQECSWMYRRQGSIYKAFCANKKLVLWLREHFGRGAGGKTIPGWVMGMSREYRHALFEGYMSADGSQIVNGFRSSSISRNLTCGIRILASTLGYTASQNSQRNHKKDVKIEGRPVKTRIAWPVSVVEDDGRYTRIDGLHRWIKIRKPNKPGRQNVAVYDITVDEDHSFVADSFVVHNCSAFSLSGRRDKGWKGGKTDRRETLIDDDGNVVDSGEVSVSDGIKPYSDGKEVEAIEDLFYEFIRVAGGVGAKIVVAENVRGLAFGEALKKLYSFMNALENTGPGYLTTWRVLNASHYGTPQARERTFIVGVRSDVADSLGLDEMSISQAVFPHPTTPGGVTMRAAFEGLVYNPEEVKEMLDYVQRTAIHTWLDQIPKGMSKHATFFATTEYGKKNLTGFNMIRACFDLPSPTIMARGNQMTGHCGVFHPEQDRKLTIGELMRVTGLPEDFVLTGNFNKKAERIGRMVPPLLMKALATQIYRGVLAPFKALDLPAAA